MSIHVIEDRFTRVSLYLKKNLILLNPSLKEKEREFNLISNF